MNRKTTTALANAMAVVFYFEGGLMFYRDFYIQFLYQNNPNARDDSINRRFDQKEFVCDIFDKLDFKGLLSLDTVTFIVGENLKDLSANSLEGAIREYIDNNYQKLTEERENVVNVVLLQYAQMVRYFAHPLEETVFYCRDAQYRGTPLREQEDMCRSIIKIDPTWNLVGSYIDYDGYDPMTTDTSGLRQLLSAIHHESVKVVVCNSMVDFSDNIRDLVYFIALARAKNVNIHFIDEDIYTNDLDEIMFEELFELVVPKDDDRYPPICQEDSF